MRGQPLYFGIALCLGILGGPMIWAVGEGIWAANFLTSDQDDWSYGNALYSAYRDRAPKPAPLNVMLPHTTRECGYAENEIFGVDRVEAQPWSSAAWSPRQGFYDLSFESSRWQTMLQQVNRNPAILARSTRFGRVFLSACLRTVLYNGLCKAPAGQIVDDAEQAVATATRKANDAISQRSDRTQCTYLDGLRAARVHAAFLPPRLR